MYYPTEVFRVQSEVQLLSYHGHMNVYRKMNPDIGRYLVFHIEFYQLISGMSGCDNSKKVDKRLELFDAISHDEMAISPRPDSLFSVTDDILVDANGYLQSCLVVCHCNCLSNVIGFPTLLLECVFQITNLLYPVEFFIACNAQVDTTCCAS